MLIESRFCVISHLKRFDLMDCQSPLLFNFWLVRPLRKDFFQIVRHKHVHFFAMTVLLVELNDLTSNQEILDFFGDQRPVGFLRDVEVDFLRNFRFVRSGEVLVGQFAF